MSKIKNITVHHRTRADLLRIKDSGEDCFRTFIFVDSNPNTLGE